MGHASGAGELTIGVRTSFASCAETPVIAAVTDAADGSTYLPALFCTIAMGSWFCFAYANSTYPIAPGVCLITPATPSLPLPPTPTGQLTAVPAPARSFHLLLTDDR